MNATADIWNTLAAAPDGGADKVALYAMISALGVALLAGVFQLIQAKIGSKPTTAPAHRKVVREHEAWERWFLLNDIDPRRIRTGYEALGEVSMSGPDQA